MSITFSVLHLSNPPHYFRLKCAPSLPHSLFFCFSIVSIRTISFLPHHLIFLHLCHARLPYHIFIEFCDVFWFPPLFLFLAWTCLYLSICSNFPLLLRFLSLASSFDLPVSRYLSSFSGLLSLAKRKVQLCLFLMVSWRELNPQLCDPALFSWPTIAPFLHKCAICLYLWQH